MWGISFTVLMVVMAWQCWRAGSRRALGVTIVLSLLVPTWAVFGDHANQDGILLFGFMLDMRVAVSLIGFAVILAHPVTNFRTRFTMVDAALIGLVAVHVISDWANEGMHFSVLVRAFGEWELPYVMGRLAFQNREDVRGAVPIVVVICVIFALLAALESILGIQIWETLFGNRPLDGIPRDMQRLGLIRSFGPAKHPIFFGVMQLLLFPWALYAASRTRAGSGPRWWRWTPALAMIGIFFTLSRAPAIGVAIVVYVAAIVLKPRWRKVLVGVGLALTIVLLVQREAVFDALHLWSGEAESNYKPKITVGEQEVEYTGTMSRVYLFEVYGQAMRRAGLYGFGTRRITGFPVQVPVGPVHATTLQHLRFIDNIYILMVLRFGYLGLFFFVALAISASVALIRLALDRIIASFHDPEAVLFASLAGAILATMVVMLTVWMPHDFGFVLLWICGAASGLAAASRSMGKSA